MVTASHTAYSGVPVSGLTLWMMREKGSPLSREKAQIILREQCSIPCEKARPSRVRRPRPFCATVQSHNNLRMQASALQKCS